MIARGLLDAIGGVDDRSFLERACASLRHARRTLERIGLCKLTARTLQRGLELLGIEVPEKM